MKWCCGMAAAVGLSSALALGDEPAGSGELAISSVKASAERVRTFERVTLEVALTAAYANPFDSSQIRLDAEVTPPAGERWSVPGFFYRPFSRRRAGNDEALNPAGPGRWQVRLSFAEAGPYRIDVRAADRSGTVTSEPIDMIVSPSDSAGFVRRSAEDHRYFVTDRGETFFPIGANVCWSWRGGTYRYDTWLPKYAENGGNYWRAWLSPHWTTFALNTPASGYHGIDLANAWRLDRVVELSERLGMRVMLCIDSFNILRSTKNLYGQWEQSPYVKANGGPLETIRGYFSDPAMLRAYRDRLRYLVARWGYSTSVFSWEFWNEVDIIDDYDSALVTRWHRDMARFLRSVDPWRHLITTSTARPRGDPGLDALEELEYVQTHHYLGTNAVVPTLGEDRDRKAAAQTRPHYHGEFGLFHAGDETARKDMTGIHLHNALYACVGQEQAGTPMTWWWDSYVDPCNLYRRYGSFARWVEGFDFVDQKPKRVVSEIVVPDGAPRETPLRVLGLIGESRGLVWVRNQKWRWDTPRRGELPKPVEGAKLRLTIPPGRWTVERWDTQAGNVTETGVQEAGADGRLELTLPPIVWDAAFRLQR